MRARVIVAAQLSTLAAVRAYLHVYPNSDFNVGGFNVHHLFPGLLFLVGCAVPLALNPRDTRRMRFVAAGFGVGIALTLDEWLYLIVTDGSNAAYLLPVSLAGSLALNALAAGCLLLYGRGSRDSGQEVRFSTEATGATMPRGSSPRTSAG